MAIKSALKKKPASQLAGASKSRQIAAGEFKAKCLGLIDEVSETGRELIITKRGKPAARLVAFRVPKKDPFFGRLKGLITIRGDLVEPTVPLEDWDMWK